jgi:hypothetical protein
MIFFEEMMTNSVAVVFGSPDLSGLIFTEVSKGASLKLLNCRAVSQTWKTECNKVLERKWEALRNSPEAENGLPVVRNPLEDRVISLIQHEIDIEDPNGNSFIHKFRKLTDVFKKFGAQSESRTTPIKSGEFETLQNRIYDKALEAIWNVLHLEVIVICDIYEPPCEATAQEIRNFLNDPTRRAVLTRITRLELRECNLMVLPPEINQLSGLKMLNLRRNQLRKIPDFINHFPNLVEIYLNDNRLSEVPKFNLPKLELINLRNNSLNEIPDFAELPRLDTLLLDGNTPMLISDQILRRFPEERVVQLFISQLNYPCQSPLATLYQAIMKNQSSEDEIKKLFQSLDDDRDKNLIFEMVWEKAGKPGTPDRQWGEHRVFADMRRFGLAVQRAITTKFDRLPQEQRNHIYGLAGTPDAKENLPRLADMLSQSGL